MKLEFYGGLVYTFRRTISKTDFLGLVKEDRHFVLNNELKNMNVRRPTACMVVYSVMADNFPSRFNFMMVSQTLY